MNSVKIVEELGTAVWKARNPDAIDRLVVDDFVITTGGVDIVTKDRCIPQRWKMALLTWIAVWPVSMLVPAILKPVLGPNSPQILAAELIVAGIVILVHWVAMPLLVKVAHNWL
jgi:antibiotic biosynthesis monooxygenase (ABM) superfamily enzyme